MSINGLPDWADQFSYIFNRQHFKDLFLRGIDYDFFFFCWERLKAEGDDRGWDGWMASLTQWTWVWGNSRRWWRTQKPGVCSPWGHKELDMTEPLDNNNIVCCRAGSALRTTYTNASFLLLLCFRPSRLSVKVNNILLLAVTGHSVARNCWENSASEFQPNS